MQATPTPLPAQCIVSFDGQPGTCLRVLRGCIWVTKNHDLQDHFLHAQQSLPLQSGLVVLEAHADSQYTLEASPKNAHMAQGWPLLWRALWARRVNKQAHIEKPGQRESAGPCFESGITHPQ